MHDDFMREHIESVARRDEHRTLEAITHIVRVCWPGGPSDRIERGAVEWVRRWRPTVIGAALPACSCADGRCALCN
jgi:hypothetical protein